MKIKTTPRYRRSRGRFVALILVIILTVIAVVFFRPGVGSYESRTEDWVIYTLSDYGIQLRHPPGWSVDQVGLQTTFSTENSDDLVQAVLTVYPNETNLDLNEWLDSQDSLKEVFRESSEVGLENNLTAQKSTSSDTDSYLIFSANRIVKLTITGPEQLRQDLVQGFLLQQFGSEVGAKGRLLQLTDIAFREVYNATVFEGTEKISEKPSITGDQAADDHIRLFAEARGYRLQADAIATLGSADGYPLQKSAASAWSQLKAAAAKDGIPLNVTSGFRNIDTQRQIFVSRLAVACAEAFSSNCSADQISSGEADQALDEVLKTSSIPGYSRHHSGHVVDIGHTGVGEFEDFYGTGGWDWISADNYKNAKRFGFVPSYPPNGGLQGPDPEPWEYAFIGGPEFFLVGE